MKLTDIALRAKSDILILDKNTMSNINILIGNECAVAHKSVDVIVPEEFWEYDFLTLLGRFKYISYSPRPYITSLNDYIQLGYKSFSSLEDIHSYLDSEIGEPVIFYLKKTCNISNLQAGYTYHLRLGFIKDPIDIRDKKLEEIIQ